MSGTDITIDKIATNRYAYGDASAINLYNVNGASGLTLPQLIQAVCIRRAATIEARSVNMLNAISAHNSYMKALASVATQVASGDTTLSTEADLPEEYTPRKVSKGCTIKEFLQTECEIEASTLSEDITTFNARMKVFNAIRIKMDNANTVSQQDAIELQSVLNWRDVTYNLSGGVVSAFGNSMMNLSGNISK